LILYDDLSLSPILEGPMRGIERGIKFIVVNSRWILAPFYLGLALSRLVLLYKFVMRFFEMVKNIPSASEADVIVDVLGLVDVALIGGLVLIVIFSGYENFVSRLDPEGGASGWPEWMTKVDFSGVKEKLLGSIVAITAIHVLETFMYLEKQPDTARLAWQVGIFAAFVLATLVLAIADRLFAGAAGRK